MFPGIRTQVARHRRLSAFFNARMSQRKCGASQRWCPRKYDIIVVSIIIIINAFTIDIVIAIDIIQGANARLPPAPHKGLLERSWSPGS